jgi:hypothetical protein
MLEASPTALGFDYKDLNKPRDLSLFSVRANLEDKQQVEILLQKHSDEVVAVFADPTITAISTATYCDPRGGSETPVGDWKTVAKKLGTNSLRLTGKGVRVAILDTGIDSSGIGITVDGGWAPLLLIINQEQHHRVMGLCVHTTCIFLHPTQKC